MFSPPVLSFNSSTYCFHVCKAIDNFEAKCSCANGWLLNADETSCDPIGSAFTAPAKSCKKIKASPMRPSSMKVKSQMNIATCASLLNIELNVYVAQHIKQDFFPNSVSGFYWIYLSAPVQVYCDMTTAGGSMRTLLVFLSISSCTPQIIRSEEMNVSMVWYIDEMTFFRLYSCIALLHVL